MARYQACTDLYMPDGTYIQAGSSFDGPVGWKPPCHAVNFLDAEGMQALWAVGPMGVADAEPYKVLFTNGARWSDVRVPGLQAYWYPVSASPMTNYLLRGAEGLGAKPPA